MSITTSQQITKFYETYKTIDVTFTKEVIGASGLVAQHVYLKCIGDQWPCIVYSSSFEQAKIISTTRTGLVDRIKKANNIVSLRFCFKLVDKDEPVSFYVGAKVVGYAPYQGGQDVSFITIKYTQRPPDDFIEILGRLLEANMNSARRKEERILITADSLRKLNLRSKDGFLFIDGVPRRCIIRDLSFGGGKLILMGLAKFLVGKKCKLRLELDEPRETLDIDGDIVRYEEVEGRKDLGAIAVHYDETKLPMSYKLHLSDYIGQLRAVTPEEKPIVPER